jgi:hypothetical protein
MKLIALVAIAVMVDGVRTLIEPGAEVKGLSEVDAEALLASGSIEDRAETEKAAKKEAKAVEQSNTEFEAARANVQAQQQSIEVPASVAAPPQAAKNK